MKWGTLRQLHTMLSRCIGPHIISFDVVIRKMLEVVRALPFTADDLHHTRNAHGTFADTLYDLADKRKAAKQKTDKVGFTRTAFCVFVCMLSCSREYEISCKSRKFNGLFEAALVEFMNKGLTPQSTTAYSSCVHVLVQSTPALTAAAHELLQRFPPKDCKTPVEVSHRLLSPRGGRGLRSPGRASDRSASQAAACSQSHFTVCMLVL